MNSTKEMRVIEPNSDDHCMILESLMFEVHFFVLTFQIAIKFKASQSQLTQLSKSVEVDF